MMFLLKFTASVLYLFWIWLVIMSAPPVPSDRIGGNVAFVVMFLLLTLGPAFALALLAGCGAGG